MTDCCPVDIRDVVWKKYFEWHTIAGACRRLRGLVPRTTLIRWIGEKRLKVFSQRGHLFAFDPSELDAIDIRETGRRIALAAEALPSNDPAKMSDAELADSYANGDSEAQSSLWLEISKRSERGGQETMRQIADAMQRRAGKLQPLLDKFVGAYWNPQRKQTEPGGKLRK